MSGPVELEEVAGVLGLDDGAEEAIVRLVVLGRGPPGVTGATKRPETSTRVTSTLTPFFFSTLALGVFLSASMNCFSQRSMLLSTLPAPLGKANHHEFGRLVIPGDGIDFELGRAHRRLRGLLLPGGRGLEAQFLGLDGLHRLVGPGGHADERGDEAQGQRPVDHAHERLESSRLGRPLAVDPRASLRCLGGRAIRPSRELPEWLPCEPFPSLGAATVLALLAASPASAQKKGPRRDQGPDPLRRPAQPPRLSRASIVLGPPPWKTTNHYQVTICEDAALLTTPAMKKYDLLIVNADRREAEHKFTPRPARSPARLRQAGARLRLDPRRRQRPDGTGSRNGSRCLGGIYSHVGKPDGKGHPGQVPHQDRRPIEAPIVAGLEDFELDDELYSNMQMMPGVIPLATIDYKGTTWPVAWTWTYGKGRVFHTSLGHKGYKSGAYDPLTNPNLLKLIIQGIDHAAGNIAGVSDRN